MTGSRSSTGSGRKASRRLRRLGAVDLGPLFDPDADPDVLRRATASLPAVFITSTAMARQWMAWGIEPDVMIGHSLGEYVAAHLAGVLSFDDALSLVITRSGLMERVSGVGAAMLVVPLPELEVVRRLPAALSLATVNCDDECVVAGPAGAVAEFAAALAVDGIEVTHIPLAAAAHSSMLDSVLDEFESAVRAVTLLPPQRRYISNLTGDWIDDAQATNPRYWVDHLRHTVRFADGLRTALTDRPTVVVEVGPGQALASYARRSGLAVGAISTLRHPDDEIADTLHTLTALGQLWMHGIDIDLTPVIGAGRRRLRLPTYPFQRERCWIEPGTGRATADVPAVEPAAALPALTRIDDVEQMGWLPTWQPGTRSSGGRHHHALDRRRRSRGRTDRRRTPSARADRGARCPVRRPRHSRWRGAGRARRRRRRRWRPLRDGITAVARRRSGGGPMARHGGRSRPVGRCDPRSARCRPSSNGPGRRPRARSRTGRSARVRRCRDRTHRPRPRTRGRSRHRGHRRRDRGRIGCDRATRRHQTRARHHSCG